MLHLIQDLANPDPGSTAFRNIGANQDALDALAESALAKSSHSAIRNSTKHTRKPFPQRKRLPDGVLWTLMGVTIDLTMIFERMFWRIFRGELKSVSAQGVESAFADYFASNERDRIHSEIRSFIQDFSPVYPDDAHTEAIRLIETHRLVQSRKCEKDGILRGSKGRAYMRRLKQLASEG